MIESLEVFKCLDRIAYVTRSSEFLTRGCRAQIILLVATDSMPVIIRLCRRVGSETLNSETEVEVADLTRHTHRSLSQRLTTPFEEAWVSLEALSVRTADEMSAHSHDWYSSVERLPMPVESTGHARTGDITSARYFCAVANA